MKEDDIIINIFDGNEYRVLEVKKKTVVVERNWSVHVMARSDVVLKKDYKDADR